MKGKVAYVTRPPLWHVSMAWNSEKPRVAASKLLVICFILMSMPLMNVSADSDPDIEIVVTPEQEYYDVADNVTLQQSVRFEFNAYDTNESNSYEIKISLYEEYEAYGITNKIASATYTNLDISLSLSDFNSELYNDTNYSVFAELSEKVFGEDEFHLIDTDNFSFIVGKEPKIEPDPTLVNVVVTCDEDWEITQNETRLQVDDSDFFLNCSAQNNNAVRVLSQLQIMGYPTPDIDAGIEFQINAEASSIDGNGSTMNFTLSPRDWNLSMIIPNGSVSVQISINAEGWQGNQTSIEINYTVVQEITDTPAEPVIILGCTDITATNFNPNATTDDGSCEYPEPTPPDCPMCNFTYQIPSQVSVDTPATFSADATLSEGWDYYGGATISWGFDGIIVNGAEVEHTYTSVPAGGTTNVTYCVQFTSGPESCQEEMITVNLSLSGYISHSSQLEPASSDAIGLVHFTIDVWGGMAPYSYEWQFDDGTTSANQSFVHEFFELGMHNVTIEIQDGRGDTINLSAQIDIIDNEGNEGSGTNVEEIEDMPFGPNTFGIIFTSGGVLFLSTLMYSNGKKNRERILKKGQLLAHKSSSSVEDSYWDDSIK